MKETRQIIMFILVLLSLVSIPAILGVESSTNFAGSVVTQNVVSHAQTAPGTFSPVTVTSLSNNPSSPDWTVESSPWTLKNGYLDGNGTTGYLSPRITSTATFSSNRTVELDFRTVTVGAASYYAARISGKYVDFYDKVSFTVLSGAPLGMSVFSGGTVNNYPSNTILDPTQWYHAKIVFAGSRVTLYLNGTQYLDFTDPIVGQIGDSHVSLEAFGNSEAEFNNVTVTGGIVQPTLVATPPSGPIGTTVSVQGTGFPKNFGYPTTVDVTFDDQFVGFTTMTTGSFNFIFNIPLAQPGVHQIHAIAQTYPTPVEAATSFTVTSQQSTGLLLTITTAAIYFPGDTAAIYLLSSASGSPTQAQSLSLTLLLPNNTARNLSPSQISTGLYKAIYTIRSTGAIGTYALMATARLMGANATAIANFEVKPTWLQSNGHTLVTATSILGAVGTFSFLGVAWRKGYFTRKKEEFPDS